MLIKRRNVNFVSKAVKFHGLCRCRHQERELKICKTNSVQSTFKQNYDCYISKKVHAEVFKTKCCFTVNTIIKEKEIHNINNPNNHDPEILH